MTGARPRWGGAVAAALAAVAVLVGVVSLTGRPGEPGPAAPSAAAPSGPAASSGPASADAPPPATSDDGLVFYVGERARTGELRLYARPAPEGGLLAAVRAATAVTPDDADLRTLWRGDAIDGVGFDGTGDDARFTVRLVDDSATTRPPGMTPREAELAVQQVVWTLQSTGTKAPVAFQVDGATEPTTLLGVPATGPQGTYVAADPEHVLNHVAVLAPAEGARVSGTLRLAGVAESFEATVGIRVVSASGEVVHDSSASAEECCGRLWPWTYALDTAGWAPGTYVVQASTDDPIGIAQGSDGPEIDTRTIVVE
jgi:hypothetical protein